MKFIFSLVLLMVTLFASAQEKIEAGLLQSPDSVQTSKIKIRTCASSVLKSAPLYVVDGIPFSETEIGDFFTTLSPKDITSISVLRDPFVISCYGNLGENGVILISTAKGQKAPTKIRKEYPFKVYEVCNSDWTISQDMFVDIDAKVPGLTINDASNSLNPKITMRGNDNTLVIIDGIRYDASILSTLDPSHIESVQVSHNPAAQNYFINN